MPYVQIETNRILSDERKAELCLKAAEMITIIPAKKPERTMVTINDGLTMLFGCNELPCARVKVDLFHHTEDEYKKEYAEKLLRTVAEETSIDLDRIYLTFAEYDNWGSEGYYRR